MKIMNSNHIRIDEAFVQDTLDFLPDYMRTHVNFCKFIELTAERYKLLDIEVVKLAYGRLLDEASGLVLDNIGSEIDVPRRGQSDDEYRAFIKLRFLRRRVETTQPQLTHLLKIMAGGQLPIIYKGVRNRIHVILPRRCLDTHNVGLELEDAFPINTNLSVSSSTAVPLIASSQGKTNERYGTASSKDKLYKKGRATSLVYSTQQNKSGE